MAHWINPDRGEMFFAKRVIFVEGETEKVVFPYLAEKFGCIDYEVSIIDCGSKFNLPLYIEIANSFNIPYLVIHDEDPVPNPMPSDWKKEKIDQKRKTYAMNEVIKSIIDNNIGTVEVLFPDFENVCGISNTQANNKGKSLAAMEFFENKREENIPGNICNIVKKI